MAPLSASSLDNAPFIAQYEGHYNKVFCAASRSPHSEAHPVSISVRFSHSLRKPLHSCFALRKAIKGHFARNIMADKTTIRDATKNYWGDKLGTQEEREHPLYPYLKHLLPQEKEYAKKRGRWPGVDKKCDVLALMLGFSPEPLLQAVVAYQPEQVLLVVNENYGDGKDGVSFFRSCIESALKEYLPELELVNAAPEILPKSLDKGDDDDLVKDNPVAVFQFLREHLLPLIKDNNGRRNDKRVLIDITGAKKSMIVGAYLFATFADVPVTYVDFDDYHEKYGKPYGYTCKIAELDNPAEKFHLSDWAEVERLYCTHAFRAASKLLDKLKDSLASWPDKVFADEIPAIEKLQQVLAVYQLWEDGDYSQAYRQYDEEKLHDVMSLPQAVEKLGKNGAWPSSTLTEADLRKAIKKLEGNEDLAESIYLNVSCIVVYARDELAKIKRLIHLNEDYRSALVRSAGLNEFLIKARLVFLWHSGQLLLCCGTGKIKRSELTDAAEQKKLDDWLLSATDLPTSISTLKGTKAGAFTFRDEQEGETAVMWRLAADDETQQLSAFWRIKWRGEDGQKTSNGNQIRDKAVLRNKAAHVFIPLSRAVAKETAVLAKKNLRDYAKKFARLDLLAADKTDVTAQGWYKLCAACGLTLLPPSRVKKGGE